MTNVVLWTPNFTGPGSGDITLAGVNGYYIDLEPYASQTHDPYRQRWTIQWDGDTLFRIKNGSYDIWLTDQGFGSSIGITTDKNQATSLWTRQLVNNLWVIHSAGNPTLVISAVNGQALLTISNPGDPSQQWSVKS